MPAFFARREGRRAIIEGTDAQHLVRSLRAREGQEIEVVDPAGFMLRVRLDRVSPQRVEGTVIHEQRHRPEPSAQITIAIANLPAPALELALSRCTEAGAFAFVVFQADRSVGRGARVERWRSICREAAMLAGRLNIPEVSQASSLEAVIGAEDATIMLVRQAEARLVDVVNPKDVTLLVGPEGGWTEREIALASQTASLGPRNLRAETAAVVGLGIALAARGD